MFLYTLNQFDTIRIMNLLLIIMILTSISCIPLQGAAEVDDQDRNSYREKVLVHLSSFGLFKSPNSKMKVEDIIVSYLPLWKLLPHKTIIADVDCKERTNLISNQKWLLLSSVIKDESLAIISIFNTDSWQKKELILRISKEYPYVNALKFSPATPDHVAISWNNRNLEPVSAIYDIKTLQPLIHFNGGGIVEYSPDGTVLAMYTGRNDINLFRTNEQDPFRSLTPEPKSAAINRVALLSNTKIALDNLTLKQIQFFDITTREKIHTIKYPDGHNMGALTLTSNGHLLMASGRYSNFRTKEATITLLDPKTMNCTRILSTETCHAHVKLLPNEQEIIASTGLHQGIHLFAYNGRDEKTGSLRILSQNECPRDCFTVSPDGAAMVSTSEKGLTYYDLPTLRQEAEARQQEALTRLRLPHWLTPSPEPRLTIASRVQNFKELQAQ
jgi:WD40 repeat protein